MDIRIYYEDTDCGGVVYYANYLKYFERARTHYLDDRGISVNELLKDGTQFMVVRAQLEYRSPAHYGETLSIETWVPERGKATMTFSHVVRERTSRRIIVEGSATLASVTLEGKLKRLPPSLLAMRTESKASRSTLNNARSEPTRLIKKPVQRGRR